MPSKTARLAPLVLLTVGAGVFLLFSGRLFTNHFANSDIAGITYNADIILDGGLPYRDTVEYKSPGTFFLLALIFKLAGRSLTAVRIVFDIWLLVGAAAVWLAGITLYGRANPTTGRIAAAGAAALYLLSAAQFEYNYSAWMTPVYAWAFTALLLGLRRGGWYWHLAAGAVAILALLFKAQAVVLAVVLPATWLWAYRRRQHHAAWYAPLAWVAGAACAALPLVILYHSHGALRELASGVLPLAAAREYAEQASTPFRWYELAWLVLEQLFRLFPLAGALAAVATAGVIWERLRAYPSEANRSEPFLPPAVLLAAAVLAAGLGGMRFFGHYLIQYLPGLALVAAHPAAYRLLRARGASAAGKTLGWVLAAACLAAAIPQGDAIVRGRPINYGVRRSAQRAGIVARAGEYIRQHTTPDDTIFAWGWWAWPVYFQADRRSPCPVYKGLGTVTTFNTNSAFTRSGPIRFKPGPAADRLVEAFVEHPPAYFVQSNYYEVINGPGRDPLNEFEALSAIIDRHYVLEKVIGDLRLYARR